MKGYAKKAEYSEGTTGEKDEALKFAQGVLSVRLYPFLLSESFTML